jgi:hypothetical protein
MYLAPCRLQKTVLANRLRFRVRSLYRVFKKFVYSIKQTKNFYLYLFTKHWALWGVEGVVRGLEGTHLADSCILPKLQ